MESQPTKRGVPLGYGLANEETDGAYSIFLRTYGCRTCRLHGARKPTSIKAGRTTRTTDMAKRSIFSP
jgi:hypothetical protein